jgi:response regulator RpfG family c-di-GMP phosphodiesterase
MSNEKTLLLVDAGEESMEVLAARVFRLGQRAVRAKTTEEASQLLQDRRYVVGAAVIPSVLPVSDLAGALKALRRQAPEGHLPFLVAGRRPPPGMRRELARAGADLALWEPADAHTLRFQINRALVGPMREVRARRALRAPATWEVALQVGNRSKRARVYTISTQGAFLATPTPSMLRAQVATRIPLESEGVEVSGRVLMTNVPGNRLKKKLPVGMAIRFDDTSPEAEAQLQTYARERQNALEL